MGLFRALSMNPNYLALEIYVYPVYFLSLYLNLYSVIKQVSIGAHGSPIFRVLFGDARQGIQ